MSTNETATLTDHPAKLEREVNEIATTALGWQVADQPSFEHAGALLQSIRLYTKKVHDVFDPIVTAAHRAHKVAVEQRTSMLAPVEGAERVLKARMGTYEAEQQRLAREAEAARQREQERLEAEARLEAEQLEAEARAAAEDAALAVAIQAEEQGDPETAEQILNQPVWVPPVALRPVFAPPVSVVVPTAAGISGRDTWSCKVTDFKALVAAVAAGKAPITLLQVNEVVANGMARALKEGFAVPGLKAELKRSIAVRA